MSKRKEFTNLSTGEVVVGEFNVPLVHEVVTRPGRVRVVQDFSTCPSMAEQHTAHMSDLNYLMEKFKPDELAAYISARSAHKQEIIGHDFSKEPEMTQAMNIAASLKRGFENLPDDVKMHFKNHVEYLKFIDNPANQEKMIALGLMTKRQIEATSSEGAQREFTEPAKSSNVSKPSDNKADSNS